MAKTITIKTTHMKVGGHPDGDLIYYPGICTCGNIKDGLHLEFEDKGGGFVVDYKDFLRIAELAKKERKDK